MADPLLSVPKSYHEAIKQIQLFADSIRVEHEYTLVPLKKIQEEWWSKSIEEEMCIRDSFKDSGTGSRNGCFTCGSDSVYSSA